MRLEKKITTVTVMINNKKNGKIRGQSIEVIIASSHLPPRFFTETMKEHRKENKIVSFNHHQYNND